MDFDNEKVKKQIDSALKVVKTVLDNSKKPKEASAVFHQYSDKFDLVDLLVFDLSFQLFFSNPKDKRCNSCTI